jgi:FkbM family methyltransferase
MKHLVKALLAQTSYRIVRDKGQNRFQAIGPCLNVMRARGYTPKVVIDGGAHIGSFSIAAQSIFPDATFHLIEPQTACFDSLGKVCAKKGFIFHKCALAERKGQIYLTQTGGPSTGAHITRDEPNGKPVAAETLDSLFGSITRNDRALLKLDLQGYELNALRGAAVFLRAAEAILTEVSFFAQAYEPPIATIVSFLNDHGFVLYDIASLSGRSRDNRLHQGDFVFVRTGSQLLKDGQWE